jgi:hypothetical protein
MVRQPTARHQSASTQSLFSRRIAQSARRQREARSSSTSSTSCSSRSTAQAHRRAREATQQTTMDLPVQPPAGADVDQDMFLLALKPLPLWTPFSPSLRHKLSPFETGCRHCNARHWIEERTSSSSVTAPEFSKCCKRGSVKLPDLPNPPEPLLSYYRGTTAGTHPSTSLL